MPFQRPSLADLFARTKADLEARLGLGPLLARSVLAVLARVLAGASHLLHGHLDWSSRQFLADTAEQRELERLASIYGLERKSAIAASGLVSFNGNDGAVIVAGTRMRRADSVEFLTLADVTIAASSAEVQVEASLGGTAGNTPPATPLALVSPVGNVRSPGLVDAAGLFGGLEEESDEDLRARLLARIRNPPMGGNAADYKAWTLAVPGVTRAWIYPRIVGAGTVGVTFVTDGAPGGSIPTSDKVEEVRAAIAELRPVTAQVSVFAPVALPLDLSIHLVPDTAEIRAAVTASLEDLILREAEPGGTLLLSHIAEAISSSTGENDHVLTVPAADVVAPTGELVQLGAITWT